MEILFQQPKAHGGRIFSLGGFSSTVSGDGADFSLEGRKRSYECLGGYIINQCITKNFCSKNSMTLYRKASTYRKTDRWMLFL